MASARGYAKTNNGMVDYLIAAGYVRTQNVANAMRHVDRANYVQKELVCRRRPSYEEDVYYDSPQRIGHDVTISAPHMHAMTLEMLARAVGVAVMMAPFLRKGGAALDVGAGSGYLTACMCELAGDAGRVLGVEYVQALVPWAEENLRRDGKGHLLDSGQIGLRGGDGSSGAKDHGPFVAIHVGAAAPRIPTALVEQLACPGRLVVPIGPQGATQELTVFDKDANGKVTSKSAGQCVFVPLHMPPPMPTLPRDPAPQESVAGALDPVARSGAREGDCNNDDDPAQVKYCDPSLNTEVL